MRPGLWDELVADAVLGTDRRPFGPDGLAREVAAILGARPAGAEQTGTAGTAGMAGPAGRTEAAGTAGMAGLTGAAGLAGAAAGLWAYRRVGTIPPPGPPPGPAAPTDSRPMLPPGPVRSLATILAEPHLRSLLGEWLESAARDGRRLPSEWLPALLDVTSEAHMADLESAGGPRVGWLAAQRPGWSSGRPGPAATRLARAELAGMAPAWEGSDDDRLAAFAAVRAADPHAGRRLAERVWPEESPGGRAAIIGRFATGLSDADEPFLEATLDDRRKEVRLAAVAVLARLPSSRYAARMATRVIPLVRLSDEGGLIVDPPPSDPTVRAEPPDPAERREGLAPARTVPDPGERRDGLAPGRTSPEQWLLQAASAAPLDAWPDPDRLVAAAVQGGHRTLLTAWSLAAERQGDVGWARRLLAAGAAPTAGLITVLGGPEGARLLTGWLKQVPLPASVEVLSGLPRPWPPEVTDAAMASLAALVASGDQSPPVAAVRDALPQWARAVDPSRLDAAAAPAAVLENLPDTHRPGARLFWGRALGSLNALAHFRQAMHQEFAE